MKKLMFSLITASLLLTGCVVVPVDVVSEPQSDGGFCPPGQAKKGNCRPNDDRGFCPPGQAKKGNC